MGFFKNVKTFPEMDISLFFFEDPLTFASLKKSYLKANMTLSVVKV